MIIAVAQMFYLVVAVIIFAKNACWPCNSPALLTNHIFGLRLCPNCSRVSETFDCFQLNTRNQFLKHQQVSFVLLDQFAPFNRQFVDSARMNRNRKFCKYIPVFTS